jgi:DNA-binding PadR family transcriptional regulator
MDERTLLLLGILKVQSQHGYQINEFIERNLARVTDMKKPTAYAILERLCAGGYVSVHAEQEGNRPPRKVYSITPEGERLFYHLLRQNLASVDPISAPGDIGLMFVDDLPPDEARTLLSQRLARLDEQIAIHDQAPRHEFGVGVDLALARHLTLLRADREWLAGMLDRFCGE